MGLLAYLIAFLIGLAITGILYAMICHEYFLYVVFAIAIFGGSLLIGIPVAAWLGIHP
ncbi:hypothetical protein [Bacillus toyonensis]|uniref:hypothetical protein n=1 Tax=Bacillus toyonensis TaxID=155322 RepID=UPI00178C785E|nr:hypothetical protein [Bacillus toyonensis]